MSVRRSPPGTPDTLNPLTKCSKVTSEYITGAGSQPDLSKLSEELNEAQITYRKRKHPFEHECVCSDEIKLMRNDLSHVSSLLEKYIDSNAQLMTQMNASIVEVKSELADLKVSHEQTKSLITTNAADISSKIQDIHSTTTKLASEQSNIKVQLTQVETKISNSQDKIKRLESDLKQLKLDPLPARSQPYVNEQVFSEIQDRNKRRNNVIMAGILEQSASDVQERFSKDESDVLRITACINENIPKPSKIYRIGKYNAGKIRRIKVCYDNPEPAMLLLRNRGKLPENIKIYSDLTPAQQKYFQAIKDELASRTKNGETDLTIKYVNGVPSIIKQTPKNSNDQ